MAQPPSGASVRAELAPVLASPAGDGGPGRRGVPLRRLVRPALVPPGRRGQHGGGEIGGWPRDRDVYIPAPRGEIFDRNGVLLAGNKIEQVVTVAPGAEAAHPGIVGELSALLGEPTSEVKAAINNVQYSPYQSVPVQEGVSNAVVLAIDENQSLLPGVSVQAEPVRYYPQGETTANIVGYVSGITGSEYAQDKNAAVWAGHPLLPDDFIDRPGRRRVELRGLPAGDAGSGKGAGRLAGPGARAAELQAPGPGGRPRPFHLTERPAGGGPGLERLGG